MIKRQNSVEIRDAISQLSKQGKEIVALAKKEVRDLTQEEETKLEEIKTQIEEKKAELAELVGRLETLSFDEEEEQPIEEQKSFNKIEKKMTKKNEKFSLLKAVRNIVNGNTMDEVTRSVVKAGQEEARKAGINTEGQIQIPFETRDAVTVGAEGEDLVQVDIYDILKPLYAKNVLIAAGAKVYNGLRGDVQIPVMETGNVTWEAETADAKDGGQTFKSVKLSPKRLTAFVDISNQMLVQDSVGIENAIMEDIVNAVNAKLEETFLGSGSGVANTPDGIRAKLTAQNITDFASICKAESEVDDANVGDNRCYIMTNKMKAALRGMAKGSNTTQLVYENGEVDGTKAYATSLMGTDKQYIYGDFSNFAIGMWSNIDIKVDPYTRAINGCTRLVVNFYVDGKVLRDGVFVAGEIKD